MSEVSFDALRVGDAEREAAATALGEHFSAGRLDQNEFEQRLTAAYAAKTRGDLDRLFVDLPRRAPSLPALPSASAPPARHTRWPAPAIVLLVLIGVPMAVGLVAATHGVVLVPFVLFAVLRGRRRSRRYGG